MELSLVLTHRCNLACDYCYAGAHTSRDMDAATLTEAIKLLYADDPEQATLSFFGGEPFLAFSTMQRAIALAEGEARARGKPLNLQCTTNGTRIGPAQIALIQRTQMHITVSIDGVREAHEAHRPLAGARSSYEQVLGGLRALLAAGVEAEAMMVITPETAMMALRSVCLLWDEGVKVVRANLELQSGWTRDEREELGRELVAIGRQQLARTLRGARVSFQPFELGMGQQRAGASSGCSVGHRGDKRLQLVVATSGNLYPCAPMVGEDRDEGPEAALRLGHLNDGPRRVLESIAQGGAGCAEGSGCACAAYLETGDRESGGPLGLWYARACTEIGRATQAALDCHEVRTALDAGPEGLSGEEQRGDWPKRRPRWLYLGAGLGLATGGWAALEMAASRTMGALAPPPAALPPKVREGAMPRLKTIHLPPRPSILGQMAEPAIRVETISERDLAEALRSRGGFARIGQTGGAIGLLGVEEVHRPARRGKIAAPPPPKVAPPKAAPPPRMIDGDMAAPPAPRRKP